MQNDAYFSQKALSGGVSIASSTRSKNDSTSTIGSGRAASSATASGSQQRERSPFQGLTVLTPTDNDERRISNVLEAQFPAASIIAPTKQMVGGSQHRKRSRMNEENMFVKEGISKNESGAKRVQIDAILNQLHQQIEQVFSKGEKGKTVINRLTILETFRNLGSEVFSLLATIINLQEERTAAQQQVAQLQLNNNNLPLSSTTSPYMAALLQAPNIVNGKSSPPPQIPVSLKHAPAERVLIFKSQEKGGQATKEVQKEFRQDVQNVIGEELMNSIEVIRPTRNGGHTLIFQNSNAREEAINIFRANERTAQIEEEHSCIVAPKKKYAKVACRDPPDDVSPASVIEDMYGKRNVQLALIPKELREARVIETKFGWIFELSSIEAAAIHAQDGRIRYGYAREMRVEEYIPIQQCYNCCNFGHAAKFCRMEVPCCRLCGIIGHAAWTCPHKDNKPRWQCANCIVHNETKGTKFPINHAAAQFHKCPCAQHHKSIRREQLVAAGIYTLPQRNFDQKMKGPVMGSMTPLTHGSYPALAQNNRRKSRSRSTQQTRNNVVMRVSESASSSLQSYSSTSFSSQLTSPSSSPSSASSSSSSSLQQPQPTTDILMYRTRMTKVQRPRSFDGWKQVRRPSDKGGREEERGRDFQQQSQGTNSTSQLKMIDIDGRGPISPVMQTYDG